MARKWSNVNLPGALHFVTGNVLDRTPIFTEPACCKAFLEELQALNQKWPSKLIAFVLMPDHFHLISNPRDGRIKEFVGALKSLSARSIVQSLQTVSISGRREWTSSLAGKLQGYAFVEWLDDLAENQLHSRQSGESWSGQISERLLLVELSFVSFTA